MLTNFTSKVVLLKKNALWKEKASLLCHLNPMYTVVSVPCCLGDGVPVYPMGMDDPADREYTA